MSYSDMCIYIDTHAYDNNKTEEVREKIYEYIYLISNMLAKKMRLFSNPKYYDDFSLWYTTQVYYRLENPKQYELDEFGQPKMTKLKSILNYIKSTIAFRKVTFEQQEYSQVITENKDLSYCDYSLVDKINTTLDELYRVETDFYFENISTTIKNLLKKIPYKDNTVDFSNIYISCLLTFLNSISISYADKERLRTKGTADILDFYEKENEDPVILYHLPDNMKNYIHVLHKRIKHELAIEFSYTSKYNIETNSGIYSLMMNELNNEDVTKDYIGD